MLRVLAIVFLQLLLGLPVVASEPYAEDMFKQANALFRSANTNGEDGKKAAFQKIRGVLNQIVESHPSSDLAVRIILEDTIDGLDISAINSFLSNQTSEPSPNIVEPEKVPEAENSDDQKSVAAEQSEKSLTLSRSSRRELQRRLLLLGHNPKGVDGVFGPGTRGAISAWQTTQSHPSTGYLDASQMELLNNQSETAYQNWLAVSRSAKSSETKNSEPTETRNSNLIGWYRDERGMYCIKLGDSKWCQFWKP